MSDADISKQPENYLSEGTSVDPGKLLDQWLNSKAGVPTTNESITETSGGGVMEPWVRYLDEYKDVDGIMKIIAYSKLNDQERISFKDHLKRYLLSPENPNAQLSVQQSDGPVKELERSVNSIADAQQWMKVISAWERYQIPTRPAY